MPLRQAGERGRAHPPGSSRCRSVQVGQDWAAPRLLGSADLRDVGAEEVPTGR